MNRIDELNAIIYYLEDTLQAARDELEQLSPGITLTSEMLHSAGTSGCGFKKAQIKVLGFQDFKKGWLQSMVGKTIPRSQWESFVAAGK